MRKEKLINIIYEAIELGGGKLPNAPLKELQGVLEQLKYGEVVIKVIDGQVESISVTNHYKPVVFN